MTRQRNDDHSTEFGLWLRKQLPIDSGLGYVATNLDYMWGNHKTGKWMLLEEKRYNKGLTFAQTKQFQDLDKAAGSDPKYHGFHLLRFEKTNPEDGKLRLDNKIISISELISFLRFERKDGWYLSYFRKQERVA